MDTETERFRPGLKVPPLICFQWLIEGEDRPNIRDWRDSKSIVASLLTEAISGKILIAAHNAAYDLAVIWNEWPELGSLVFEAYAADGITCTWVREKLLDISRDEHNSSEKGRYSLDGIVKRKFKHEMIKDDAIRTTFDRLRHVPLSEWPEDHVSYALDDVMWGMAVCQEQRQASTHHPIPTELLESRAYFALHLTSAWGLRTDPTRLEKIDSKLRQERDEVSAILFREGILRFKRKRDQKAWESGTPLSELDLSKKMAQIQGLVADIWDDSVQGEALPLTESQKVKTSKDTLEKIDHPVIETYLRYQALNTTITRYSQALWDGTRQPIHTRFNLVDTSRSSSSGPNLQNFPRLPGMRECVAARPGTVFINCDFAAQEMRTLADTCVRLIGHSRLAERFGDPKFDPHVEYACVKMGISPDEGYRLHKAKDPDFKKQRQRAKIPNFGIPGGMGKGGIVRYAWGSYGQRISIEEAKGLIDTYFEFLPEMTDFFETVRAYVGYEANYGSVTVPQLGFTRGGCRFTSGANCLFQAPAAHCSKAALFDVVRACYDDTDSPLYGARVVNFIHDEIMLECDEEYAPEAAEECGRLMVAAMERICTHVPSQTEATLSRYWAKDAEPVYKDGRLAVWEGDLFQLGEL